MISGISDRSTIRRVFSEGRSAKSRDLRVRYLTDGAVEECQVAFSISKKVGNAVARNRIRRRLRSALNEIVGARKSSVSAAMIVVYPSAVGRSYSELREQLDEVMKKIELSMENG